MEHETRHPAPSAKNVDLTACFLDLLSFVEEQLLEAKAALQDRPYAVDAASGVIPYIQRWLDVNPLLQTQFMLMFGQQFDRHHWREWWHSLRTANDETFSRDVDKLLELIATLRPGVNVLVAPFDQSATTARGRVL